MSTLIKLAQIGLVIFFVGSCSDSKSANSKPEPIPEKIQTPPANSPPNVTALLNHLKEPTFPQAVKTLFEKGITVYQDANSELAKARKKAFAHGETFPAGRRWVPNWIEETFGVTEPKIIEILKNIEAPPTWSIAEIDQLFTEIIGKNSPDLSVGKPKITIVKGFGVNQMPDAKLGHGILQLASQFNYLESPNTERVTVSAYADDKTQGPAGSIEAAAAALHRTAAEIANKLNDALQDVLPPDHNEYYQNGYFMIYNIKPESKVVDVKNIIKNNINQLRILPQWVTYEATGKVQLQVLAAAPAYQGATPPPYESEAGQICDLLVSAQYEALAKLAVIMSVITKKEVPVHLTLVGQGAFRNPPEVMKSSLEKVATVIKGYPQVRVFVHAFTNSAPIKAIGAQLKDLYTTLEMDAETFINAE